MICDELEEALPDEGSRGCKWLLGDIGRLEVGLKKRFCYMELLGTEELSVPMTFEMTELVISETWSVGWCWVATTWSLLILLKKYFWFMECWRMSDYG